MREALRAAGHARAEVDGTVRIDTQSRQAEVTYRIEPGNIYTLGSCSVEGHGNLPDKPILAAASLHEGKRYSPRRVKDIQAEVYALGAFSAVELHEEVDEKARRIDLRIDVTPHSPHALRAGVGVLSGAQQRTDTGELRSVPQWDAHLFGRYEKRHVFGTLGKFRIEERPRIIFSAEFPGVTPPSFGNLVAIRLNQPGLIEARTDLFTEDAWDFGPDPFLGFERSDVYFRVGARRAFFHRKLSATLAVQQDLFIVDQAQMTSDGSELPSGYGYSFLEQDLRLDLRDNATRPDHGAYFSLNATQAPRWRGSDWTAFRLAPEARGYVPLFWDIVWATRVSIAGLFIQEASSDLDATSQQLGPNTYRLRGGGANSNRGFLAGQLGVGRQGGVRRWEASSELRVPFGRHLVLSGFADVGDVNDEATWRFEHLNLSLGWGLRYYTILGAIRLDVGLRVLSLQTTDGTDLVRADDSRLFGHPGALHLTIGDAF
jgi:outer membrane translocation and assembly module TamA